MSYGPWSWTWEIQRADDAKRQRRRTRSHFMNAADYIYIAIAVVRAIPGMIYYSCFYRRSK